MVLGFLPLFSLEVYSEEFYENTDIFIHNPKVSLTKYLGFDSEPLDFSIFIQNMNKTHSTKIELIPGTLTKSSESILSNVPEYIHIQKIGLMNEISSNSVSVFHLFLQDAIQDESSYSGIIQLKQGTKDPEIINVDLNYKTNPLVSIIFAIIGMGTAGIIGILFSWKDTLVLHGKSITPGDSTIEHVNRHIEDLNRFRHRMPPNAWRSLQSTFQSKKSIIDAYRDMLSLSEEQEEVKWLDTVLHEIEKKYYTSNGGKIIGEENIRSNLLNLRTIFRSNKAKLQQKIIFGRTGSKYDLDSITHKLRLLDDILEEYERIFDGYSKNKALPLIKQLATEVKIREYEMIIHNLKIYTERNKIVKMWDTSLKFLDSIQRTLNDSENYDNYSDEKKETARKLSGYIHGRYSQLTSYVDKLKDNLDTTNDDRNNLEEMIQKFIKKKERLEKKTKILDTLLYEKAKKLANKDILNKKSIFQVFAMGIIAIPSAVFITDNFSGPVFLNGLISFATGFAVYKIPDVKTIFKR